MYPDRNEVNHNLWQGTPAGVALFRRSARSEHQLPWQRHQDRCQLVGCVQGKRRVRNHPGDAPVAQRDTGPRNGCAACDPHTHLLHMAAWSEHQRSVDVLDGDTIRCLGVKEMKACRNRQPQFAAARERVLQGQVVEYLKPHTSDDNRSCLRRPENGLTCKGSGAAEAQDRGAVTAGPERDVSARAQQPGVVGVRCLDAITQRDTEPAGGRRSARRTRRSCHPRTGAVPGLRRPAFRWSARAHTGRYARLHVPGTPLFLL